MLEQFSLDGQQALVTGCSRGIGAAMAQGLAAAGADIIGLGSTLHDDSEIAQEVRRCGRNFTAIQADLSDEAAVEDCCHKLADLPIDIVINNAGIIRRTPAVDHAFSDWQAVMQVNLHAPWRIAQAVAPGMITRGHGRMLFTASLLSFQGGITVPGYAASKGAIAQLTKALANEWSQHGVTVNAIAPGYIATDATAALRNDPPRAQAILDRIPAGRWGQPEDLAGAAVFLASPAANYISGQVLTVDGGWLGR